MSTRVAITIPEQAHRQAQRLAQMTHCQVNELLANAITLWLAPVATSDDSHPPVPIFRTIKCWR